MRKISSYRFLLHYCCWTLTGIPLVYSVVALCDGGPTALVLQHVTLHVLQRITHRLGSWPGKLQGWSDPHHHQGELSSTTLASYPMQQWASCFHALRVGSPTSTLVILRTETGGKLVKTEKWLNIFLTIHFSSYCMSLWVPTEKHSPEGPPQCWLHEKQFHFVLKSLVIGAGDMIQRLWARQLSRALGFNTSISVGAHNHLPIQFQKIWCPFLDSGSTLSTCSAHKYFQVKHLYSYIFFN